MRLPELLAPAGGMAQLRAAVRFGADAVYGALPAFGLRAFAGNFSWEELAEALALLHGQKKKFYLTLNILPYEDELPALAETARRAWEMGVDAALVSDLGAFLTLRRQVPGLKLHISTQANTLNAETARFYFAQGAERIVLARELSLERIRDMRRALPEALEIEAFVHGAMCMSYSGRCMLSDHLTGRGGNRGACAQPCRWEYALVEKKRPGEYWPIEEDQRGTYLLSAYDLNMLSYLPQLIHAGIASLKIEGRMKTEYYVATVVGAYRRALDALKESEEAYRALLPQLEGEVRKASHRPFNTGFYFGQPGPEAQNFESSAYRQDYRFLGIVREDEKGFYILQKNKFAAGRPIEAIRPDGTDIPLIVEAFISEEGVFMDSCPHPGQKLYLKTSAPLQEYDILREENSEHETI